ncbi:D-inositol-3-phosphate glycosyltransferase [compost metagenome]
MIYRSILKSVLTLQPGYSLRALNNKFKLVLVMTRQWSDLRSFMTRMSNALGSDGFEKLGEDCIGVVQWPYISKCWNAPARLAAVASHYEAISDQFPALLLLGRDERLTLCDLSSYSSACTLVLDRPIWFKREGELVLNVFQSDLRVASIAFTLSRTSDGLCLFIGAVQGIHKGIDSERSLSIYRDLTKDFEGLRPRSFLIEAIKCVARTLGATRIYAVGDAYRHHRHPYFGAEKAQDLAANYDVIWLENGATPSAREDFFNIPLAQSMRAADDIAAKKRAMYRRRQALLDDVFAHIESALAGTDGQRQLQLHRQRLGAALAVQEVHSASTVSPLTARAAALLRHLVTEPRVDQRFRAYVQKAGLYPTLRKVWQELLKQGPGLLWKAPDAKKSLPLGNPDVPASDLFANEVVLIGEADLSQHPKSRVAQIQQALEGLGYRCRVVDWRDHGACLNALQMCCAVIFFRVPAFADVLQLIEEARRLKVTSYWDADDLIFDPQAYRQGNDLTALSADAIANLLAAVALYQQALLSCDRAIAATATLALAMTEAGARHVTLVEQTPDAESDSRSWQPLSRIFPAQAKTRARRVLSANIFFAPRSYGGATIIAEQMTRLMAQAAQLQPFVFTSLPVANAAPYGLFRYEVNKVAVIGMGLPDERSEYFENPATIAIFEAMLSSVAPDLVHLHSVQGLGAQLAESCRKAGIPFVVTLHDTWWICGRQFMINNHGQYCGQTRISTEVCAKCVDDPVLNDYRQPWLANMLKKADLLLAPSKFARDLYIANGFDATKIRVNNNGILAPAANYRKQPGKTLRFGYVGGNVSIKGVTLLARAFASLNRSDYELKVVDSQLHLGLRSFKPDSIKIPGTVTFIPGYAQANMDAFYSGIDVLLFPTQLKETFGLSVREALARDVWVISTQGGGTVEDIVDGVNGTIIPLSTDEKYLRQALSDVLENQQRFLEHRNPFKASIKLCSDQALELQGIYEDVLKQASLSQASSAGQPSVIASLR